jgi:hypothetical protein
VAPDVSRLAALAGEIDDWSFFLRVVGRHRIAGLAYRALGGHAIPALPAEVEAHLRRLARTMAMDCLGMAAEAIRLVRVLERGGVPVAVLKGAPLAMRLHGDPGLRHAKDIDLLVPPQALEGALRLLTAEGYEAVANAPGPIHHELIHPRHGFQVELHWALVENRHQLGSLPPPSEWDEVSLADRRAVKVLPGDFGLLYLFVHGARHCWFRLKWVADIAFLMARESESRQAEIIAFATAAGAFRPVAQGMILAHQLTGSPLPSLIQAAWRDDAVVRWLVRMGQAALMEGNDEGSGYSPRFSTRASLAHYFLGRGGRYLLAEFREDLLRPRAHVDGSALWPLRLVSAAVHKPPWRVGD